MSFVNILFSILVIIGFLWIIYLILKNLMPPNLKPSDNLITVIMAILGLLCLVLLFQRGWSFF